MRLSEFARELGRGATLDDVTEGELDKLGAPDGRVSGYAVNFVRLIREQ